MRSKINRDLEELQRELNEVERDQQVKMEQIMEDTRIQLDTYVMTQPGQMKLNKAVDMLISKGKSAQEARDQAYMYFLKKMSSQHEKRLGEELDAKKQQIRDEITKKETQKIVLVEELNTLG